MKVLVKVKPSFHASFGFSLIITDIDPAYTLGDIARKLAQIRKDLNTAGCFDNQKQLKMPFDYTRVAVLSPENAAGLGDFKRDAQVLSDLGLTEFDYFAAYFQGEKSLSSIVDQLRKIYTANKERQYDCLVIIRGGGAVIDFNYLNEYKIAFAITQFKLPIFTGIGHEKDSCILDEVSHKAFDTPSKVILHIKNRVESHALNAEKNIQKIHQASLSMIGHTSQVIHQLNQITQTAPAKLFTQAESHVKIAFDRVHRHIDSCCQHHLNYIQQYHQAIIGYYHDSMNILVNEYQTNNATIMSLSRQLIERSLQGLSKFHQAIYRNSLEKVSSLNHKITTWFSPVSGYTQHRLSSQQQNLNMNLSKLTDRLGHEITRIEDRIHYFHRVVDISSPKNTLKRGFSIVRSPDGKAIADQSKAIQCESLQIEMRDGKLNVTLEEEYEQANAEL